MKKERTQGRPAGKKGKAKSKRPFTSGLRRVKGFITRTFKSYADYLDSFDRVK